MKLTGIEVHTGNSSDITLFSFRDPKAINPYNVKGIDGLDAASIIPQYYGSVGSDKYYTLSLEKRDIVIKVGLNPNFSQNLSYSDLRDALYKKISSSRTGKLTLQFMNGSEVIAGISGFVSKFESAHFERLQEVQITLLCDEPMLKALTPTIIGVSELNPLRTVIRDDESTAPHGFSFIADISAGPGIPNFTLSDPNDDWVFDLEPVGGFLTGDALYFSSDYNRYVYIIRNGVTIYLADAIVPGSVWPLIFPGDNVFSFSTPNNISWRAISYYPTYWGV